MLKVEFIEPLVLPEDEEEGGASAGETVNLGADDIPEGESFSPESMYRPSGEDADAPASEEDGAEEDEPNLFDI